MKVTNIGKINQLNTNLQYVLISKLSVQSRIHYVKCMIVMNNLVTTQLLNQVVNNFKLK